MPSPLSALRGAGTAALDRSAGFFEREWVRSPVVVLVVVAAVAVLTAAGVAGLGVVFEATIDQQITVDNPAHTPDWVCEDEGPSSAFADGCDEPETIQVDAGSELRDVAMEFVPVILIGVPIWWIVFGGVLHLGARLANGEGSIGDSLAIAAWAIVPELLRLAAGIVAIHYALDAAAISGATPEALVDDATAAMASVEGPLAVASLLTIAVQWWIVVGGLETRHDLPRDAAAGLAALFGVIAFLFALL